MSMIICRDCGAFLDSDEVDTYPTPDHQTVCEDCYATSPEQCEEGFSLKGECICGQHQVCLEEKQPTLELR